MSVVDVVVVAQQFAPEQKRRLLACLAFELTISPRQTYVPGSEDIANPRGLRAFNEIQHRVTSSLVSSLDSETYADWLWRFMDESARAAGIDDEVEQACVRAFRSMTALGS